MPKLVGYARVSTKGQETDRQVVDLLAAGIEPQDIYKDEGVSGARARRPGLDRALASLEPGDTFTVCTLDRLGRSTVNMLELATDLQKRDVALRVLNLGGGDVNTREPMGRMVFTVMAALAEMELAIKKERINDSVAKRKAKGGNLGGRPESYTDGQIRVARDAVNAGQPITRVCRDLGMSTATFYRRVAQLDAQSAVQSDK